MTIHKEGKGTLTVSFIALFIINALVQYLIDLQWLQIATLALSVVLYAIVL
ncbi:MAG TPA: phosphatidylserine decarboxylase family protein, partial [Cryomorphaceae bacterium]|nr:phosphatidylserine decarboxylase family protein [Cryomorphaceae bacterium]